MIVQVLHSGKNKNVYFCDSCGYEIDELDTDEALDGVHINTDMHSEAKACNFDVCGKCREAMIEKLKATQKLYRLKMEEVIYDYRRAGVEELITGKDVEKAILDCEEESMAD